MLEILLNGQPLQTAAATLEELLHEQQIEPQGVAVALAQSVVSRAQWGATPLFSGAKVTVIRATQGG